MIRSGSKRNRKRKIQHLGMLGSRKGFFSRLWERALNAKFRKLEGLLIVSGEGCVSYRLGGRRAMSDGWGFVSTGKSLMGQAGQRRGSGRTVEDQAVTLRDMGGSYISPYVDVGKSSMTVR